MALRPLIVANQNVWRRLTWDVGGIGEFEGAGNATGIRKRKSKTVRRISEFRNLKKLTWPFHFNALGADSFTQQSSAHVPEKAC